MGSSGVSAPQESSSIPVRLRQLILRGLRPNPADRYPSMGALLDQLVEAALLPPCGGLGVSKGSRLALALIGIGLLAAVLTWYFI